MNLKIRFLILAAALMVVSSVTTWLVFRHIAQGVIEQWGVRLAEKQALYDKSRLLQPLMREIALVSQLANSPQVKHWARNSGDEASKRDAIAEMESFRPNFQEGNYFVAFLDSGAYYFNNADNEFAGRQLRYHLNPDKAKDRWFYQLVGEKIDTHVNVNPDQHLGITKLWIDVLIRDGDRVLGVVGTGLNLDIFMRNVADSEQPGVLSMFLKRDGTIQFSHESRHIDFARIKPAEERETLDSLLKQPAERDALKRSMQELADGDGKRVASHFVHIGGKRYLAGVAYIPEIEWYELTLLDLRALMPLGGFSGIAFAFLAMLLVSLMLFHVVLSRLVITPLGALEKAMTRVRDNDFSGYSLPVGHGEIRRLIAHFDAMAAAIRTTTHTLEAKVRERTEELNQLACLDPLTKLLNRRGMHQRIKHAIHRIEREGGQFGLLWVDIDTFKGINDRFGHAVGDQALVDVATLLQRNLRPYDSAARWGGDEFLVLLLPCDADTLPGLGERIRAGVEAKVWLPGGSNATVSVGAYLASTGESMESILRRADEALYAAKAAGRNCLRIAPPPD